MAEKKKEQLEKELAETLVAKAAAEEEAKLAKEAMEEAKKAQIAAEEETKNVKQKNEELFEKAKQAEEDEMKHVKDFFQNSSNEVKSPDFEKIKVKFPTLRGPKAPKDVVIMVNGREWQIQRGVVVEIPMYVYKAYKCSQKAEDDAADFIEENAS